MKKLILTFGFIVAAFSVHAQTSITGVWNMGKDNSLIDIKEANGINTGTVISSDNAELKGKLLLKDVKLVGQEWKGQLYVPRLGKWADVTISKKDSSRLLVAVSAGLASRTVEWVKH